MTSSAPGKIAHVITESQPFGGAQRNTLLTLKGLARDGYDAELVCGPGGPLIPAANAIGVRVYEIPDLVRSISPWKDYRAFLSLYRLFQARRYQIVHTHSTKAGVLGRMAARWARVPTIIHTVHSVPPLELNGRLRSRIYFALERWVGSFTHNLICVGELFRQEVSAWKVVPDEKLLTIYSGIDFPSYVPRRTAAETKQQLGVQQAWPIIGCIGRLTEQKAQHFLIEAVALLKDKYPRVQLILVGDGELRPFLEKRIGDLALSRYVLLLGERDDVADLLNVFDIYAMSSRWEGVGRALTEAMYRALPIVATSVNGVKEMILHEETGLVTPPCDPEALASAVDRLTSDRELAQRLGANAQQKAEALMDGQHMISAIEELYAKTNPQHGSETSRPGARRGSLGRSIMNPEKKSQV